MKKRLPQVKIIGGNFKGFKIQFIPNKLIRPTSNKTRETLFNWLMHDIQKAQCLDMFAGTGAIGLEALSRGAEFVFFVEKNKDLCECIQKNLNILSLEKKAIVINEDSLKKDFKKENKFSRTEYEKFLIKNNMDYYLTFLNDTVFSNSTPFGNYSPPPLPLMIVTSGFEIFSRSGDSLSLVYSETGGYNEAGDPKSINQNIILESASDYWTLNTSKDIITDIFEGLQLTIVQDVESAVIKSQGWYEVFSPDKEIIILPFPYIDHRESKIVPWDFEITFLSSDNLYIENKVLESNFIYDHNGLTPNALLLNSTFDFNVMNMSFNHNANLVVHDQDNNGEYDKLKDLVLVGSVNNDGKWLGTSFVIDFRGILENTYPDPGDIYSIEFKRPFWSTDTLHFQTFSFQDSINVKAENNSLDDIRVVPNPYVGTNVFEEAILNSDLNQRRKLMFTHLPARCKIKIYTISGVLVDEINVFNSTNKGIAYWDLLTNEGLEVSAGMYVYHVESFTEGSIGSKVGKFGVIK